MRTNRKYIRKGIKMKEIFSKYNSLIKKYGFINTLKKILSYINSKFVSLINPIQTIKLIFFKKKYLRELNNIFNNSNYERIIIWRSSFGWNVPLFQRPQHISNNLSKNNCLIFYEVTKMTDEVNTIKKIQQNLYLINFQNKLYAKLLEKEINKINKPKYLQFYSTDWTLSLDTIKKYINNGYKIIYEYIDDINPLLSGTKELPVNIKEKYEFCLKDTENTFVIVTADNIERDVIAKRENIKVAFACNGVDYDHFQNIDKSFKFDDGFNRILSQNKPIIGYYGALASWFDYNIIKYLAKKRPNYNIVLFGIKYDDSLDKSNIIKYSNIFFLGSRDYNVLQNYANKFNVCTIPFLLNDITNSTSPVKLFEYMALHKPIVTTAMPECKKYKSVIISNNNEEFIKNIDLAINLNKTTNSEYFNILKNEALDNTWKKKALKIINLIKKYE